MNIEIIVINDGSTDGTLEVVSSFHDERIIIINQNNSGVYAARNAGLDAHRGKWLMFLDADDDVSEGFIYERYQLAEQHDVDVLVRNAWRKWSGGGNIRSVHCKQPYDRVLSGQAWLKNCVKNKEWPHYLWLQVVRSEYIEKYGITFHTGKSHKDILWTTELALNNGRFYLSEDRDYTYIYNKASITNRGDYFDIRAGDYIDVISKLIAYSRQKNCKSVRKYLLKHALVESRHFLGLYRNKVENKNKIKRFFNEEISLRDLMKGISNCSYVFFFIKLAFKLR